MVLVVPNSTFAQEKKENRANNAFKGSIYKANKTKV